MRKAPAGNHNPLPNSTSGSPASLDALGDLPRSYGTDTIFLVAQEPHWLFTYWDIDIARHPGGKTFLRVLSGDDLEKEIEVPFETRNWYIPVNQAGGTYTVEIGFYRAAEWQTIARSAPVHTPPMQVSDSMRFEYATIPLHLSFQRLMDGIQGAISDGEALIEALARLQRDGRLLGFGPGGSGQMFGADERLVLEALLGKALTEELFSGALSSEEMTSRIREKISERLDSGGASELSLRAKWSPAENALFSELAALAQSGSWTSNQLSSWAAAAITSWATAARASLESSSWSSGAESSWVAPTSGTTGALSSWLATAASSWAKQQTTASSGGMTPLTSGELSSWLQAAGTSWAGAVSSWSPEALSSWSHGALTSWSGGESSSWGSSDTFSKPGGRDFFLHVNAEVIFYGATHPLAKVTIDGEPIKLNPDGSFRYHFLFPDGRYEIPVVATSPDGVETRSAMLKFERGTARNGDVGHTGQPPLPTPLGAKA